MQTWIRKSALVGAASAALGAVAAAPAHAEEYTLSTTGAQGTVRYVGNGDWSLFARDPLTDGHCARWQVRETDGSSWHWQGDGACSGSWAYVGSAWNQWSVRICRTGTGNCSGAVRL